MLRAVRRSTTARPAAGRVRAAAPLRPAPPAHMCLPKRPGEPARPLAEARAAGPDMLRQSRTGGPTATPPRAGSSGWGCGLTRRGWTRGVAGNGLPDGAPWDGLWGCAGANAKRPRAPLPAGPGPATHGAGGGRAGRWMMPDQSLPACAAGGGSPRAARAGDA